MDDQQHTYGLPLRPSTPIRAVIGNFYGEIAGFEKQKKYEAFKDQTCRELFAQKNPSKSHTRASEFAQQFVRHKQDSVYGD